MRKGRAVRCLLIGIPHISNDKNGTWHWSSYSSDTGLLLSGLSGDFRKWIFLVCFSLCTNLKLLKVEEVIILIHTLFLEEDSVNLVFNGFNLCGGCRVFFHKFQMSSREALCNLVR